MATLLRVALIALALLRGASPVTHAQRPTESPADQAARRSREAEARGLAEPFRGITADGKVQPGLFAIRSTGVSTAPVRTAATAWLKALSEEQRKKTMFPVDDPEWRKWMNQHIHVVVRTPNGNDYGPDLLRQHYGQHAH